MYKDLTDENSCEDIEAFINENKYPIMKKLDSFFIKRLQKDSKTLILAAVSVSNQEHMHFIKNQLTDTALGSRKYVFSYIDNAEDSHLFNYFKITGQNLPKLVAYNFGTKKFLHYTGDVKAVTKFIEMIEDTQSIWISGNWFEDTLAKFGIQLSQTNIMYMLGGCFVGVLILLIIVMFYCGESNEKNELNKHAKDHNVHKHSEHCSHGSGHKNGLDHEYPNPSDKKNQ